ncbi:hypothetical protein CAEBREN_06613 [Caenorhabditis brenneri]|uniref:Uncharacterized protein n=1 Tax=Caenorhabditis brenneri TaxID=135651 RepID=G0MQ07_CAEBE|nr:hypothetical protein CAEBREN_06613 [Caenorhabditis brenneri]
MVEDNQLLAYNNLEKVTLGTHKLKVSSVLR